MRVNSDIYIYVSSFESSISYFLRTNFDIISWQTLPIPFFLRNPPLGIPPYFIGFFVSLPIQPIFVKSYPSLTKGDETMATNNEEFKTT